MGGINSLTGLNNVSVDFRPTVGPNAAVPKTEAPKTDGIAVQQQVVEQDEAKPPVKVGAGSIVRQLDVLLVNAASKSVAADAAGEMKSVGKKLVDTGILGEKDAAKTTRRSARCASE